MASPQADRRRSKRLSEQPTSLSGPHAQWLHDLVPPLRDLVRTSRKPRLYGLVGEIGGVHVPEHVVLALTRIGDFQPIRLSDLALQLDQGRTTVSRQVAELVRLELVTRTPDPDDGRAATLTLTDQGAEALHAVWGSWEQVLGAATKSWNDTDRRRFLRLLSDLSGALDAVTREGDARL